MMTNESKSKAQLLEELSRLRSKLGEQEALKTERDQLVLELERRERRFQSVIENINVGLYRNTIGPKGKFIDVNSALTNMFGYSSKDEILNMNVSDFYLKPEDRMRNRKIGRQGLCQE